MRVPTLPSLAASRLVHLAGAAATLSLMATACVSTDRPTSGFPHPPDIVGVDAAPGDTGQDVGVPDAPSPDVDTVSTDSGPPPDSGPGDTGPPSDSGPGDTGPPPDSGPTPDATPPDATPPDAAGSCGSASDCPQLPDPCTAPACVEQQCAVNVVKDGTPCGDASDVCHEKVCSSGLCVEVVAAASCDDADPCTSGDACDANGACVGTPVPEGASCDDGIDTTQADMCLKGACAGFAMLVDPSPCGTTNLQHTVATSVLGTDVEWSFARVVGPADNPDSLSAALWTSAVDGASTTPVTQPQADIFVGIRAGFAVTQTLQVFTYTSSGPAGSFAWGESEPWTTKMKAKAPGSFTAHAMWAIRHGGGETTVYVVGTYPTDKAALVVCSQYTSSLQPECWTQDLGVGPIAHEVDPVAIAGAPDGNAERVFAVLNSAQVNPKDSSVERYFVDLWTGGPGSGSWLKAPFGTDQLQIAQFDRARALLPLGPARVLVLEEHGGLFDVTSSATGSWGVAPAFDVSEDVLTWSNAAVTYVAGLATPAVVLLVGQVQLPPAGENTAILRRVSRAADAAGPDLLEWEKLVTDPLGPVGQPLGCMTSACPRVGIYDAALAPAPSPDEFGAMMLVGATRPPDSQCLRATRLLRAPSMVAPAPGGGDPPPSQ